MSEESTPKQSTPPPAEPVAVPRNVPGQMGDIELNSMPKYQAPPPPPPPKTKD